MVVKSAATSPCDSCMDVGSEEAGNWGLNEDDIAEVLSELGGDIADHLCDEIETDGEIRCGCGCHLRRKRELRKGKNST